MTKQTPTADSRDAAQNYEMPVWHRPEITRVSLSETMFTAGSPIDGATTGNQIPPP